MSNQDKAYYFLNSQFDVMSHSLDNPRIYTLKRLIKLMLIVSILWGVFVMAGFFGSVESERDDLIRIPLPQMRADNPYLIRYDNKQLIVMLFSTVMQKKLFPSSAAPPSQLVALAYGTHLGCPLEIVEPNHLKETCSDATYDFAGRPLNPELGFTALPVPVYTFCPDYSCLKIKL